MSEAVARRFIDALGRLEEDYDLDAVTECFAYNCEVGNVGAVGHFKGIDGCRDFWTKYREAFDEIKSTYRNVIVSGNRAALEWTTEGTTHDGGSVNYSGVSILETNGEKIIRFQAYFDADVLARQMVKPGVDYTSVRGSM